MGVTPAPTPVLTIEATPPPTPMHATTTTELPPQPAPNPATMTEPTRQPDLTPEHKTGPPAEPTPDPEPPLQDTTTHLRSTDTTQTEETKTVVPELPSVVTPTRDPTPTKPSILHIFDEA